MTLCLFISSQEMKLNEEPIKFNAKLSFNPFWNRLDLIKLQSGLKGTNMGDVDRYWHKLVIVAVISLTWEVKPILSACLNTHTFGLCTLITATYMTISWRLVKVCLKTTFVYSMRRFTKCI